MPDGPSLPQSSTRLLHSPDINDNGPAQTNNMPASVCKVYIGVSTLVQFVPLHPGLIYAICHPVKQPTILSYPFGEAERGAMRSGLTLSGRYTTKDSWVRCSRLCVRMGAGYWGVGVELCG